MKISIIAPLAVAGLLVGCGQRIEKTSQKFNELPPQAQKTIRAQAPNAEILDISRFTTNGMDAYEVEFRGQDHNRKVVVGANGTLLGSELGTTTGAIGRALTPTGATGTPFSALPAAVQKTIQ